MPLLDHDECDPGLVVFFQLDTSLADGQQLVVQNLRQRKNMAVDCFVFRVSCHLKTDPLTSTV